MRHDMSYSARCKMSVRGWLRKVLRIERHHDCYDLSYENVLMHVESHSVPDWFLAGAKDEDAQTLGLAISRIPKERFQRDFARMLAQ